MSFFDDLLDPIFNKKSVARLMIGILVLAIILRIIAAINLGMFADDTHFAAHAVNFINSGKLETYDQSASLWYLFTDLCYKMFGTSQLAARLAAVIFGSFSVILIFLVTKHFFSEKAGLIAAFLLAISPFAIKNMMSEMDSMVMFFVLFGMYFFLLGLKSEKTSRFLIAGVFLGLGIMTKLYALFFIPSLILYALYYCKKNNKRIITKKLGINLLIFVIFSGLFFVPALTHNYILYKDKGIMDFQFTRMFNLGEEKAAQYYSWDAGWKVKADFLGFFIGNSKQLPWSKWPTSLYALGFILYTDFIVFILGLLGLVFLFFKNRKFFIFFILAFIIPFFYLASIILLPKHYIFVLLLMIPAAAYSINWIISKFKIRLRYLMIVLLIISLIMLGAFTQHTVNYFYGESPITQVIDYKKANIPESSLVVFDSRIYRNQGAWIFNDRHYAESSYLADIVNASESAPGQKVVMDVYFLECVSDNCGWGDLGTDFNQSVENIVNFFKQNGKEQAVFYKPDGKFYYPGGNKIEWFKVYKLETPLNPAILSMADSTHQVFLYPIGYSEKYSKIFDKLDVWGIETLWHAIARFIQIMGLIIAILSLLLALYILVKKHELKDEAQHNNPSIQ